MALIQWPSNITVQDATLNYAEFTVSSISRTRKLASEYISRGGRAGAGFVYGTLTFPRLDRDTPNTPENKQIIDQFLQQMAGDRPNFPWTKMPFGFTGKRTPATTPAGLVVESQTETDGDLITTLSADWDALEVGMWVNIRSNPRKTCFVYRKVANNQFVFVPQHKIPNRTDTLNDVGFGVQRATEVWIRKNEYNPNRDRKIVQSKEDVAPQTPWRFEEITQQGIV